MEHNWYAAGKREFSPNGTNAAQSTLATFAAAGTYNLEVTVVDSQGGQAVTSYVNVIVEQTLTSISVSPGSATLLPNGQQQFTATALDQFGTAMAPQPSFTWSTASGATNVGTISASGLLTAGTSQVTGPVTATVAGIGGNSTVTISNTSPTISIGAPSASYTAGGPITYAITYTDPNLNSSNLVAGDITLNATGAAVGTVSVWGSGLTYTVTISGITGNGTLGISIAAGTASDKDGLLAPAAGASAVVTVDNVAPTISIGGPSAAYAAGGPVTYTVTYADANFNSSTLSTANIVLNETGSASGTLSVLGSGLTRTVTISSITGNGTLGISISAGTASDKAGNLAAAAGPSTTFTVDNIAPTISISGPSAAYAAGGPVTYTVTYADANFNSSTLSTANIALNETGSASGTLGVSGSGLTRTVTISSITGNGTLGISISAGTASDKAGNLAAAAGPSATFTVDNIAPTISISGPSESYTTGGPIDYTVTYADANFASGDLTTGDITLIQEGTASGTVSVSGSGLSYTVAIGGITGNGTLGISIAAGTATDLAGNTAPASSPSAGVTVDTTGPALAEAASATPDPITGTSADLAALGADIAAGEQSLTYTWLATGVPAGAAPPLLGADNGTNAAQNITAVFSQAGDYTFQVTIADPFGLSTTSSVDVAVNQTLTSIVLSPASATLAAGSAQFTGVASDQFGNALTVQPALNWSVIGGGSIAGNGLYTPPYASGSATVYGTSQGLTAAASVTYSGQAQWASATGGSWGGSGNWQDSATGVILAAAPGVRGIVGDKAAFDSPAGGTVTLDSANPSLAGLAFDSANGYTIAPGDPGGTLCLDNGTASANIAIAEGRQTISVPVVLDSSVVVLPAAGSQLTISGPISGEGSSLTLDGNGSLVLSGANSYGDTTVSDGTLVVANSSALGGGSSLMVGAGAGLLFGSSLDATSSAIVASAAPVVAPASADATLTSPASSETPATAGAAGLASPVVAGPLRLAPADFDFSAFHTAATHRLTGALPSTGEREMSVRLSAAERAAADLAWLWQTENSFNHSDQRPARLPTIQTLDALFAQYGG